jgi:hypothetical protein
MLRDVRHLPRALLLTHSMEHTAPPNSVLVLGRHSLFRNVYRTATSFRTTDDGLPAA